MRCGAHLISDGLLVVPMVNVHETFQSLQNYKHDARRAAGSLMSSSPITYEAIRCSADQCPAKRSSSTQRPLHTHSDSSPFADSTLPLGRQSRQSSQHRHCCTSTPNDPCYMLLHSQIPLNLSLLDMFVQIHSRNSQKT